MADRKCVYYKCSNRVRNNPNITFFSFPKTRDIRDIWLTNCGNVQLLSYVGTEEPLRGGWRWTVCEKHFSSNVILKSTTRKLLIRGAVPFPCGDGLIKPLRVNITPGMKTYTPKKSCHINIHETEIKQENDDFETTIHQSSLEKSEEPDADVVEIKTEHSFDISSAEEPDSHSKMGSTATYSTFQSVKNEHWDGVKQENQLLAEVKSEKQETSPTVDNTKFENMDTMVLKKEFEIKSEYDEDAISDLA
ncbi:unnamed protein product [Acanthoscelides obtectus]|uniref:THAP-type domain-containing protein n=1 Tax=Acanthoscelides obtectus TaxID=200917 RepID=A0A9P0JRE5_ACAOB|nr:unnamed protein product [Acanthoscelides obtectus]CAK1671231.1 hypothetical protein AOBTE_LOCUS28168 [Acanthoscelides obtectus]